MRPLRGVTLRSSKEEVVMAPARDGTEAAAAPVIADLRMVRRESVVMVAGSLAGKQSSVIRQSSVISPQSSVRERTGGRMSEAACERHSGQAKFREFLVRRDSKTTPSPLPLFCVSVDSRGVRESGLVTAESKGVEVPLE